LPDTLVGRQVEISETWIRLVKDHRNSLFASIYKARAQRHIRDVRGVRNQMNTGMSILTRKTAADNVNRNVGEYKCNEQSIKNKV